MKVSFNKIATICILAVITGCDDPSKLEQQKEFDAQYHRIPDTTNQAYSRKDFDHTPYDVTGEYNMHRDLKDCKVYWIPNEYGGLHVVKCLESHTTTMPSHKNATPVEAN